MGSIPWRRPQIRKDVVFKAVIPVAAGCTAGPLTPSWYAAAGGADGRGPETPCSCFFGALRRSTGKRFALNLLVGWFVWNSLMWWFCTSRILKNNLDSGWIFVGPCGPKPLGLVGFNYYGSFGAPKQTQPTFSWWLHEDRISEKMNLANSEKTSTNCWGGNGNALFPSIVPPNKPPDQESSVPRKWEMIDLLKS